MKAMEALTKLVVGTSSFGDHLLKKKTSGVLVAALAFLCGASLVYALKREPTTPPPAPSNNSAVAAPRALTTFEPACYDEEGRATAGLEEWKHENNGAPLRLDYDLLSPQSVRSSTKVVMLPTGGSLTGAGKILYRLDAGGRVVWKHTAAERIKEFVHVAATGTIYATAGDHNTLLILDATTGGRLLASHSDGGGYRALLSYGEETCLAVEDHRGYRTDCHGGHKPMPDGVSAWRGTRMLWHTFVPADAELQVVGSKIYAVTKTKSRILIREIKVPPGQP